MFTLVFAYMALVKYLPIFKMAAIIYISRCWQGSGYRRMLFRWS